MSKVFTIERVVHGLPSLKLVLSYERTEKYMELRFQGGDVQESMNDMLSNLLELFARLIKTTLKLVQEIGELWSYGLEHTKKSKSTRNTALRLLEEKLLPMYAELLLNFFMGYIIITKYGHLVERKEQHL